MKQRPGSIVERDPHGFPPGSKIFHWSSGDVLTVPHLYLEPTKTIDGWEPFFTAKFGINRTVQATVSYRKVKRPTPLATSPKHRRRSATSLSKGGSR